MLFVVMESPLFNIVTNKIQIMNIAKNKMPAPIIFAPSCFLIIALMITLIDSIEIEITNTMMINDEEISVK